MTSQPVRIPAIRIQQNSMVFYVTAVPASRLLTIAKVDVWRSGVKNPGYQRAPAASRKNQIAKYLAAKDAVLPVGGLLNARREDGDQGTSSVLHFEASGSRLGEGIVSGLLELPPPETPLWIVDMQHRLGGFEVALQRGEDLADFPIVVTIADGLSKLEEVQQFELINTTQKKIRTDLARRLLEIRAEDRKVWDQLGEQGKRWQARGPRVVDWLNKNCPVWRGGIMEPNASKKDRPSAIAKETSFVTSLKPVLNTPLLSRAPDDQIAERLSWYWQALAGMWKEAFDDPKNYVVQKTPGLFSLHNIAPDVFELARQTREFNIKGIRAVLKDLDEVDSDFWHKTDGTAGQFGNMKGFSILAEELRSYLPAIDLSTGD